MHRFQPPRRLCGRLSRPAGVGRTRSPSCFARRPRAPSACSLPPPRHAQRGRPAVSSSLPCHAPGPPLLPPPRLLLRLSPCHPSLGNAHVSQSLPAHPLSPSPATPPAPGRLVAERTRARRARAARRRTTTRAALAPDATSDERPRLCPPEPGADWTACPRQVALFCSPPPPTITRCAGRACMGSGGKACRPLERRGPRSRALAAARRRPSPPAAARTSFFSFRRGGGLARFSLSLICIHAPPPRVSFSLSHARASCVVHRVARPVLAFVCRAALSRPCELLSRALPRAHSGHGGRPVGAAALAPFFCVSSPARPRLSSSPFPLTPPRRLESWAPALTTSSSTSPSTLWPPRAPRRSWRWPATERRARTSSAARRRSPRWHRRSLLCCMLPARLLRAAHDVKRRSRARVCRHQLASWCAFRACPRRACAARRSKIESAFLAAPTPPLPPSLLLALSPCFRSASVSPNVQTCAETAEQRPRARPNDNSQQITRIFARLFGVVFLCLGAPRLSLSLCRETNLDHLAHPTPRVTYNRRCRTQLLVPF